MIRLRPTPLLLLFVLSLVSLKVASQNQPQRYWIIGGSTNGVRFDQPSNTPSLYTKPGVALGAEGGAVVTDAASGTLLFYTDGVNVYDINNSVMPNGSGLQGGANTNNPAAVIPVPGQPDQYYIITNNADYNTTPGTIRISTVDMSLPGNSAFPLAGDVTTKNQAIPGLTGQAEGMIVIPDANGTDYWLISQTADNNEYFVTHFAAGGSITTTQITGLGVDIAAASFAYNATTGQLAVAPQNSNTDIVILNFDDAVGTLTFDQYVLNSGFPASTTQAIYDVEWSNSGQYLYYSIYGEAGVQADVKRFDTINPGITMPSILPQPNTINQSYGLQIGPDGNIYHLYENSSGDIVMGRIENSDSVISRVTYIPEVFPGTIFNATQFPSFTPIPDPNLSASFTSVGTCSNAPSTFFPNIVPNADSVRWDFGDGGTSTQLAPTYTYQAGGNFPVVLTAYLNGDSVQVTQNLNITQFDLQLNLVQDTTACSCELPFPKANPAPASCGSFSVTAQINGTPTTTEWFGPSGLLAAQTTATLTPDSAGYYYIKVSDATGCFAYAGVNIKEYGIQDQRANIWYFGNGTGLDFNGLPDDPIVEAPNPVMNAPEGTSTISDRNGQVIIFTDGETIWDRNFNVLATGIGGDQDATQSSIIVPVPGDETLYYIFTTQAVANGGFEMNYSLYDLKIGTAGAVVQQDVLLFSKSTERVASTGNWLIAHEWGNNNFRAYPITPTGIGNAVISSAGSDHSFSPPENAEGYMKFGANGLLAVAIPNAGGNTVELFDFADSSGVVSNPRVLDVGAAGQVYGVEFSPGGNKLFATVRNGGNTDIYEFAIDSLGQATQLQVQNVAGDLGAMQVGPDGQIYIAANGNLVYYFSPNETLDQITPLATLQNQALAGSSTAGLPNFVQNISTPIQGPSMNISGFCLGTPTDFTGTPTDAIDIFAWTFGDGSPVDNNMETSHTYAAASSYNVSLNLTNRCGLDTTLLQTIKITAPPPNPSFIIPPNPVPATLCNGPYPLEALPASTPGIADLSFIWSTGETTRTIIASTQGNYRVTIVDTLGCFSTGSLIVADPRPAIDLGNDRPFCEDDISNPSLNLGSLPAGSTIQWAINGSVTGVTSPVQPISTTTPGNFQYTVQVSNMIGSTTCVVEDTVIVTINPRPHINNFVVLPTTTCGADDGSIAFDIVSPSSKFTYSILGPPSFTVSDLTPVPIPVTTGAVLQPLTYGIIVLDQVSGCLYDTTASVNDNAFTVSGIQDANCDPIGIATTTDATSLPLSFRVINVNTTVIEETSTAATAVFNTSPVPSNNQSYIVEVTDNGGCVQSSLPIVVNQNPTVPVTPFTMDGCVNPITVTANGGTSWTWTGPNITSATNLATITATPPQGLQDYNVLISQAGFCDLDTTIQVLVDNSLTSLLSQSDFCSDNVTVSADPSNMGLFVYTWSRNGTVDPLLAGPQVQATTANDGEQYSVSLYNNTSGCSHISANLPVSVVGQVTVDFQPLPLICEGDNFTLIAIANKPVSNYDWSRNGVIINGQNSFSITQNQGGLYKATVNFQGCPGENQIQITPNPKPNGNLPNVATICNDPENPNPDNQQITLDVGAGFVSYQWSFNGTILPSETSQSIIADEPGKYTVTLENAIGCFGEDVTRIDVDCVPELFGPNAFRPSDLALSENREFYLFSFFINDEDFQIFIFNRWGEMVFQSSQKDFKWNGGYNNNNGKPLPPGTYSWVAKYKSDYRPERGTMEKRGGVVLVR